jgi:putative ABC transport system permease protein
MILFTLHKTLKLGVNSLLRHLLRSVLTMLGIVFGVGAVVAMLAVGEGASYESQQRIKRLGSDNIIIKSVKPPEDQQQSASTSRRGGITANEYGLTYDDAEMIQAAIPSVKVVLPMRNIRQQISNGARSIDGQVIATVPWYLETTNQRIAKGRFIKSEDMHQSATVCVIGTDIVKRLFPFEDPIGKSVRMGGSYYNVIGVMQLESSTKEAPGEAGLMTDINSAVIIPRTTAMSRFGKTIVDVKANSISAETVELHQITVKVNSVDDVLPVSGIIQRMLDKHHPKKDYEMIVPLELLHEIERSARMFTIVLGMIAALSLLVGGIGIMNIMLASVTERTREIGIRRALGAKRRDIVIQFLSETVLLSIIGGVLGLGVGFVIPVLIKTFTGMNVIFSGWSPPLAFSISAIVGLVFGIYPAYRAAHMDPIEALRHE